VKHYRVKMEDGEDARTMIDVCRTRVFHLKREYPAEFGDEIYVLRDIETLLHRVLDIPLRAAPSLPSVRFLRQRNSFPVTVELADEILPAWECALEFSVDRAEWGVEFRRLRDHLESVREFMRLSAVERLALLGDGHA
jgi:hypothetical protein